MRLTQVGPWLATGIDIGLGRPADHKLSAYEEMFLPMRLRDYIRGLRVSDGNGGTRPLVKSERQLLGTISHPEPTAPPRWLPLFLAVGVLVGILFAVVGRRAARGSVRARYSAGILFSVWSFAAGFLGVILALLWAITDHTFAHQNENLLLFNPLWLVLAVLAPMTAVKGRVARTTRGLTFLLAALAAIAPLLHLIGLSRQNNWLLIALGLPPVAALAWAVHLGTAHSHRVAVS
jgi:hypothetical protein